jgi:nucleoid-associated protein YgaU
MTSDAKIGLLLGLIFIFVIAFIINGLPRFRSVTNNSELTTNMVSTPSSTLGIGANERRVQEDFDQPAPAPEQPLASVQRPLEKKEDVRFTMKLPPETSLVTETPIPQTADQQEPSLTPPIEPAATPAPPDQNAVEKAQVSKPEPAAPAPSKVYVVCEGDTLAEIAQKLYGPEEGNKKENVTRIFAANRQVLKSPDQIYAGQKLTIPPLKASGSGPAKGDSVLSGSMFEKVVSIGRKHLFPDSGSAPSTGSGQAPSSPPKGAKAKPAGEYVVRDGDNLSRIAAQQLGDANRYIEIAKLNADQLKDPNNLTVGMQLKMPAR